MPAAHAMPDDDVLVADVLGDLGREPMGLYEVLHAANTLYPSSQMSARMAATERVIRRLVVEDRVRLWRGLWIGPHHDRESVTAEKLEAVLLRPSTWVPESGNPVVWMELVT